jgi:hypothetical protein
MFPWSQSPPRPHKHPETWPGQPHVLMQYCGYAVWNVHTKAGRERPSEDWVIAERGHEELITEEEARGIAEARRSFGGKKQFNAGPTRSRTLRYLLSGGLFRCGRCGANMIGFHTDGRFTTCAEASPIGVGWAAVRGCTCPRRRSNLKS